ncbi:NADH-quinone oxidoreductase subunit J [Brevibacillus sp. NL20B1]|jgi:NADH-quinone oxidoreductase subunit J|uniref:NADH-quinone oxidoreductase subunit J n=1 Tax=Brevibacillus sp. NL20B1 TaxID=2829799 RepID=UPI001B92F536|nr:NADH-quinone oxidoreductase subunit J [Brevibacillus sp. NL20B1]MBR8659723.1 NADH-quinone oxidoreductase subunit J [Brevibacillus sp. NL20B1]
MTGEFLAFFILSLLTIGGAVFMISFTRVVHMVISLGITFISIAGLFILLDAEFIGVAQVLVYSGAISILMLFGIMLTKHDASDEGTGRSWKNIFSLVFVAGLFGLMFWGIQKTTWTAPPEGSAQTVSVKQLGVEIFTKYVIPFELASVLLLVALVGAIIMAKKEGDSE